MKFLVFQHAAAEHPGSFRDFMQAAGHTMHAVELDAGEPIPALDDFDILLVMGGPMDVWQTEQHPWLHAELAAIRQWVTAGRPYLGLCLGAQLLAQACGGQVRPMQAPPEIGIYPMQLQPDPIFASLDGACTCFQWHGAEVGELPPDARLLASSPACRVQAFALGTAAYALQFHLELTQTTAAEWGELPEYAAALEQVQGPNAMPALLAQVNAHLPALQDAAGKIFGNFLRIAARALADTSK
jgi:GMP synthase-like glutamine amidotransferase